MWSIACRKVHARFVGHLLQRLKGEFGSPTIGAGKCNLLRFYSSHFVLEEFEDGNDNNSQLQQRSTPSVSLAKSLACLPDETSTSRKRSQTRMELKRSIELRIKKRVKAQYVNGKFYDLMDKVIANADTLQDSYDIIRLNSNVELTSNRDDLCFLSMAEQLASGGFDIQRNIFAINAKSGRRESLVLPKLKLRVIQEAIRIVLEVVYRPHFSKISHGCRSGRDHQSALRYICKHTHVCDWWFTLSMNKEADEDVLSKLISVMEEKIDDAHLFDLVRCMFDARVLNLTFGGFPKGHGLPQEGVLSPILMNIYLGMFDGEVFRMSMRHEGLGPGFAAAKGGKLASKLRNWVRRQMKDSNEDCEEELRLHVCRFMDEIFVSVSGSRDAAVNVKTEMVNYLKNSLHLDVVDRIDMSAVKNNPRGIQFLGTVIRVTQRESEAVRAVHKLKDKMQLFASNKQEIWDSWTVQLGKKWLAYGLRRIKESEIKSLGLSTPMLDHISEFRKEGMKTDHWFKSLVKIWMQDVNANTEVNEEVVLSKYIAEPALPHDLRESFYEFQKQVKDYVSSEAAATLALLPNSTNDSKTIITSVEAPIGYIIKSLDRYGLINIDGFPRYVSFLVLQEDSLIISWFTGLVHRWLKWYSKFDNFREVKPIVVECVRKSCIRTLAAKYRIHESLIEKKFELEMSRIPMTEDFETEVTLDDIEDDGDDDDEALMYGIPYSGLCVLSLSRVKVPTRVFNCFVMGCTIASPSMYTIHVKERQRFPGWTTGFSTSIHPSLNGRRIGLCYRHIEDLYLGHISLQSIEFGALSR